MYTVIVQGNEWAVAPRVQRPLFQTVNSEDNSVIPEYVYSGITELSSELTVWNSGL